MGSVTDDVDGAILDALATSSPLHVEVLAEQLEFHPVAVDQACARLHDDGQISLVGYGRYGITGEGRRLARAPSEV